MKLNITSPKYVLKSLTLQFGVLAALFYLIPLPAYVSINSNYNYLTNMLLIMNPAVVFGLNILYCLREKFRWYVPLLGGAMFVPSIFLFYNITAMPYVFIYMGMGYVGAAVGVAINSDAS